jgi:hypothetical protein
MIGETKAGLVQSAYVGCSTLGGVSPAPQKEEEELSWWNEKAITWGEELSGYTIFKAQDQRLPVNLMKT